MTFAFARRNFLPCRLGAFGAATAVPSVTFSGTGRETGSGGAGVAFVISSAAYPLIRARCVTIDPSGRAAVRQDVNNDATNGCN